MAIVIAHFFPEFIAWLDEVDDPRQSNYVVFPIRVLVLLGVLMFLGHAGSRNHFNDSVRDAMEMARTLARLLDCSVEDIPHLDTLEKVLRSIDPDTLQKLLTKVIRRLIRMKALDGWRVGGRFLLAIDGTGLYSFRKRHCAHCIKTTHESGAITYSHKLLVAFIVNGDGYALPITCDFIENPGEIYDKQDCENKAFHRLAPRLKHIYPQTQFWLLLDALYADQNVLRLVFKNGWNAAITFKESDMPALWTEAQSLLAASPAQTVTITFPNNQGTRNIRWINDLEYEGMKLSAVFQTERDDKGNIIHFFAHLCCRYIDHDNVCQFAAAARLRWRCENEGFNVLKNGGFALEHVYSYNPTAAKGYVTLMFIAHIIQQLLTRGRLGAVFKDTFHTFLNYGRRLLDALKHQPLPENLNPPGQIRLSTA